VEKFRALVKVLEALGPYEMLMPKNKNLKNGLFELRDTQNGHRYYYCPTEYQGKDEVIYSVVLLLVCGDKNNPSSQRRDIEKARKRMEKIPLQNIESGYLRISKKIKG
jgi:putative component of toxin-antitoxin plasmid stabilization module